MKMNPAHVYEQEDSPAPKWEAPAAHPDILRHLGNSYGATWIYQDPKMTAADLVPTILRPWFWRRCCSHGVRPGDVIELRLGKPDCLSRRSVAVVEILRGEGGFILATENSRGDFKRVAFTEEDGKEAA